MKKIIKTGITTTVEVYRPYLVETIFFNTIKANNDDEIIDFTTLGIGEVTYDDVKLLIRQLERPGSIGDKDATPGYNILVKYIGGMADNDGTCECAARNGHLELLKWLRSGNTPSPWNKWNCIRIALNGKHDNIVDWILEK